MPELAFFRRGEELLRVALGVSTRIGRAPENDVSLPDPTLSRLQAVIERQGDSWLLRDHSGRGTAVNGAEVAEAVLADGAEIALGTWRALFRAAGATEDDQTRVSKATVLRAQTAPEDAPPARIRIRQAGRERTFPLPAAGLTLGTDPGCEVRVDDPFVSARHLRLEAREGRWQATDLGSTNGTWVGGARIDGAQLELGAVLRLGDAEVVLEARERADRDRPPPFEGMLSSDPAMREVFDLVGRVGPSDAAVTILGDTGTGKELVARALHARSGRAAGPFIPVNCSAIAETLIESELFGHEKGSFSGAERLRKGAFEEADGGTIFLDEIGELPVDL